MKHRVGNVFTLAVFFFIPWFFTLSECFDLHFDAQICIFLTLAQFINLLIEDFICQESRFNNGICVKPPMYNLYNVFHTVHGFYQNQI